MVEEGYLNTGQLFSYWNDTLSENLMVEAVYCRAAYIGERDIGLLNDRLSALRLARETREASLSLGRRFLGLAASLTDEIQSLNNCHLCVAFGYAGRRLGFSEEDTIAAYLHQAVVASISAAQRLLALGQIQSSAISWDLKAMICEAVARSAKCGVDNVGAFAQLPELASMRHPFLETRLFIS